MLFRSRPFSSQVIGDLRKLMRSAVRHGAGRAADVGGSPVFGQVGSSVLSPGGKGMRTSWFVGYQGKIAFAVVELTRSPSMSAAPLAGAFLRDLRTGS